MTMHGQVGLGDLNLPFLDSLLNSKTTMDNSNQITAGNSKLIETQLTINGVQSQITQKNNSQTKTYIYIAIAVVIVIVGLLLFKFFRK